MLRHLAAGLTRRVVRYGLEDPGANLTAVDVALGGFGSTATVVRRGGAGEEVLGTLTLHVPGRHNVLNALAAIGVALELGVGFADVVKALGEFRGAERRFERKGEARGVTVVDDYGHHPTEVAAVLQAARGTGARRVVCVFQPHRYTRTAQLLREFGPALALADQVVLTDIYPAGEDPIPGITVEALAEQVRLAGGTAHVVAPLSEVPAAVARLAEPGDLVITMGAGIDRIGRTEGGGGHRVVPVAAPADKRFRRSHVRPSRRRAPWVAPALIGVRLLAAIAVLVGAGWYGASVLADSGMLHIKEIRLRGNQHLSRGEVMVLLSGLQGQHILRTDLNQWRRRMEGSPWVAQAAIRRVLPSTVEVVVQERTPMAIGRLQGDLYLVDEQGIVIDQYRTELRAVRPADRRRPGRAA